MLLCTKTVGCNKLDGHRTPCDGPAVKITPKLVTISYRKDGKEYLLSMPSEHAGWAEEMLNLDRESVERAAAEKALKGAADAVDTESTVWIAHESRPRGGAYWGAQDWLRARAEAYRREETE